MYPRVDRYPAWLPELVLHVQTDEGEVEERSRVLMREPLGAGMTVPFRGTKVTLDHVEEIDGTFYAVASA